MTHNALRGLIGSVCLFGLAACVVEPPRPVVVRPAPIVVAPPPPLLAEPPVVVVRPQYWHRRCPPGWHPGRYGRRCWPN